MVRRRSSRTRRTPKKKKTVLRTAKTRGLFSREARAFRLKMIGLSELACPSLRLRTEEAITPKFFMRKNCFTFCRRVTVGECDPVSWRSETFST